MNYGVLSKTEMGNILDIMQRSLACHARHDVSALMGLVKELVCADQAICGLGVVDPREGPVIFDLIDVNYPEEWLAHYAQENLYRHDPVLLHQLQKMSPQFWHESYSALVEKPYQDFINRANDFGLRHGIATGCGSPHTDKLAILSFAGDQHRFDEHHKILLDTVVPHLFQGLVQAYQESKKKEYRLTDRQVEVVEWLQMGKSSWEISQIMDISESTIKFHIQNVKKKLNAVNRSHVVAIAKDYGLISTTPGSF